METGLLMNTQEYLDRLLTEEEHNRLPVALAEQRDKWIETLATFETEHPQDDGGESTDALIHLICMRNVLDIVTKNMFLQKGDIDNVDKSENSTGCTNDVQDG